MVAGGGFGFHEGDEVSIDDGKDAAAEWLREQEAKQARVDQARRKLEEAGSDQPDEQREAA